MTDITFNHYPHFFTATILEWKHLLYDDEIKDIIIRSLEFMEADKRIKVYGFVIMPDHIQVICLPRQTCGGKFRMPLRNGKFN